ncbi:MAG: cytochrome c oxidase subunit 2 [Parasphingorhabdus sp.]|jgi:cytochrome c oxidase subunit 2
MVDISSDTQPIKTDLTSLEETTFMPMKTVLLISILLLVSCNGRYDHGPENGGIGSTAFISNGERIYFSGTSASGLPISASGGGGPMSGMHRQMHGGGCASCHGADREGQRLWPQFWIKAPALSVDALFGDDSHDEGGDGHGDHAIYDAESLRRAISRGLDPAGESLDQAMPRWSMNPSDLDDLISFLSQSHDHE